MYEIERKQEKICFTICLFTSPDSDGNRAQKNETLTPARPATDDMFHDMLVH